MMPILLFMVGNWRQLGMGELILRSDLLFTKQWTILDFQYWHWTDSQPK